MRFTQRKAVAEHFDKRATEYFPWYSDKSWMGYAFRARRQRVIELFDQPGRKVLDVGCGPGVMVPALMELGCEFWGVDSSTEMVRQARDNFGTLGKAHFSLGTAESLPFADDVFDAVICMGVIEFVDDDGCALEEMVRVLKPGGSLIVAFPNKVSPFRLWRDYVFYPATKFLRPIYYRFARRLRKPHVKMRTYTERATTVALTNMGCQVTHRVFCAFLLFLPPLEHIFPHLSAVVGQRLEVLGRGKLRWLGSGFVMKAQKQALRMCHGTPVPIRAAHRVDQEKEPA